MAEPYSYMPTTQDFIGSPHEDTHGIHASIASIIKVTIMAVFAIGGYMIFHAMFNNDAFQAFGDALDKGIAGMVWCFKHFSWMAYAFFGMWALATVSKLSWVKEPASKASELAKSKWGDWFGKSDLTSEGDAKCKLEIDLMQLNMNPPRNPDNQEDMSKYTQDQVNDVYKAFNDKVDDYVSKKAITQDQGEAYKCEGKLIDGKYSIVPNDPAKFVNRGGESGSEEGSAEKPTETIAELG